MLIAVRRAALAALATVLAVTSLLTAGAASATAQPAAGHHGRQPVPAGFRAQSDTWISANRGWVLGTAPCGTASCTTVIATTNRGRSWHAVGQIGAPLAPSGEPGVTEIRFADARHGWAYGPDFFVTDDGGRTWHAAPMPGGGQQALTVAASAGLVYLAVSPCAIGEPQFECTTPTTLWQARVHRGIFHQVPVTLPVTAGAVNVNISLFGKTGYVAVGSEDSPDTFFATTNGRTFSARPSPCSKTLDLALTGVAATSRTGVALICAGNPAGTDEEEKDAFRSDDTGMTTTSAGSMPLDGFFLSLAASHAGTLAVDATGLDQATGISNWIYLNNTGGQTWATAFTDMNDSFNDLTFASNKDAYVVESPAAANATNAGTLLASRDGGQDWAPLPLTTP